MKKFKTMSELAEGLKNPSNLLEKSKEEALAICKHLKKCCKLSDNFIPDKVFWDSSDRCVNPPVLDFEPEQTEQTSEFQSMGISVIVTFMWMFDISKKEICKK